MLRQSIVFAGLLFSAQFAAAAEAGKIIFVAGQAQADAKALALGASVDEGQLLSTGADGYIYIKTLDDGLFILRPNTRARIATYRVDKVNPANTRVKLELLSGTARSKSGTAVKLARQNFRFNTPVAAIGVRGTDFTVYTDDQTSRIAVLSGGITVSGFAGACRPDGTGPCEGSESRELYATQKGQLLQVKRGAPAAQLLPAGPTAPDAVTPPRPDEPTAAVAPAPTPAVTAPALDPIRSGPLQEQASKTPTANPGPSQPAPPVPPVVNVPETPPVNPQPPVTEIPIPPVTPIDPVVVVPPPVPPEPPRTIVWGRFQPIADKAAEVDLNQQSAINSKVIALKGDFALLRTAEGSNYVIPERGSVGFALQESQAYIYSDNPSVGPVSAQLENGQLKFDFDKRKFATSFDLVNASERFNMHASGSVARDGRFSVDSQFGIGNNMIVDGVLSSDGGGSAAYLFQGRIPGDRTVAGGTLWGKIP